MTILDTGAANPSERVQDRPPQLLTITGVNENGAINIDVEFQFDGNMSIVQFGNETGDFGFQLSSVFTREGSKYLLILRLTYGPRINLSFTDMSDEKKIWVIGDSAWFRFADLITPAFTGFIANKRGCFDLIEYVTLPMKNRKMMSLIMKTINSLKDYFRSESTDPITGLDQKCFPKVMFYTEVGRVHGACHVCKFPRLPGQFISVLPCGHRLHKACCDMFLFCRFYCPKCGHYVRNESW